MSVPCDKYVKNKVSASIPNKTIDPTAHFEDCNRQIMHARCAARNQIGSDRITDNLNESEIEMVFLTDHSYSFCDSTVILILRFINSSVYSGILHSNYYRAFLVTALRHDSIIAGIISVTCSLFVVCKKLHLLPTILCWLDLRSKESLNSSCSTVFSHASFAA